MLLWESDTRPTPTDRNGRMMMNSREKEEARNRSLKTQKAVGRRKPMVEESRREGSGWRRKLCSASISEVRAWRDS